MGIGSNGNVIAAKWISLPDSKCVLQEGGGEVERQNKKLRKLS
jgi:hypothetical protein